MNGEGEAFWLVWNPKRDTPTVQHPTCERAIAEAQRLARINAGETFYVLAATDSFTKDDVRRTRLTAELPF